MQALNQPWFEGWGLQHNVSNEQANTRVAELFDSQNQQWDLEKFTALMGPQSGTLIQRAAVKPTNLGYVTDRLIWILSKRGYNRLRNQIYTPRQQLPHVAEAWQKIWTWKDIIPRVRTFLWRALHDGLPTAATLHRRIHTINPVCTRCRQENEFLMHLLFYCPISRATWYGSQLSLQIEGLPLDFTQTLMAITANLTDNQISEVCNLLWCLRN